MKNKVLILSPHADDEILGCGGSLLKLKKKYNIYGIFMTNGVGARNNSHQKEIHERKKNCEKLFKYFKFKKPIFFDYPDNKLDSIPLLEVIKPIEKKIKLINPTIIFTHSSRCLNIDHRKIFDAVITACRPIKRSNLKKILSFEVPSSSEWSFKKDKNFQPNYFIDITKQINNKVKALKFYKKELRKYPHSRSIKGIKSLSEYRGTFIGVKNAEAFYLVRYSG